MLFLGEFFEAQKGTKSIIQEHWFIILIALANLLIVAGTHN